MPSLLRRLIRHHTAAAAYVALILALGGTAYAASLVTGADILDETIAAEDIGVAAVGADELASRAVSTDRLADNSVNGTKVADGTIWTNDVRNGTLTTHDVADQSLTGFDIADGSVKASELGLATVTAESNDEFERVKTVTAHCPAGKRVISGGGDIVKTGPDSPDQKVDLAASTPSDNGTAWTVRAQIIDHPGTLSFTLSYNDDGVVDGIASWIVEDDFSFRDSWAVEASAICV
jgi:hypothetical protein